MRKSVKKNLLEIVQTVYSAHGQVKKYLDNKEYDKAQLLLGDCQQAAVDIGGVVEQSQGEGFVTVRFLEDYCEALYELAAGDFNNVTPVKAKKILDKKLLAAENSIRNDIKCKLEAVFMPYKASMWDSLESIWRQAQADDGCDAYVVPIPYYDRNSDFSLGECHYEGGKFPSDVPVVSFNEYNLELRHPDVIFIHNPYDANNTVTSVDSRFYSSELKKYTDNLIYVPYCVYDEHQIDSDPDWVERYIMPAIAYSDKVIFQSEKFRKAFVDMIVNKHGGDRKAWENKVLGLGSPKYDAVNNSDRLKKDIPEQWLKKMTKSDGSPKMTVFYNTSIGSFLNNPNEMNGKIKGVIDFFREHSDEYTLLWRPHPLMETTFKSSHPELWGEYKQIVDNFKQENWGIYDDTPRYETAFAASDAYYGDYSSLILLWHETGKPLLEQRVAVKSCENGTQGVCFNCVGYDGQYVWATAANFNGLYRLDPITLKAELTGRFPNENNEVRSLFSNIAVCGDKLFFCPYNAENIGVYNKATGQFSSIELKEEFKGVKKKFSFAAGEDNGCIFLIGLACNAVARLNAETEEITYFKLPSEKIRGGYVADGKLFSLCPKLCGIACLDLKSGQWEQIKIEGETADKLGDAVMLGDGDFVWISQCKNNSIICVDLKNGSVAQRYELKQPYCMHKNGESVYAFSIRRGGDKVCKINRQTKKAEYILQNVTVSAVCEAGEKLLLADSGCSSVGLFDYLSLSVEKKEIGCADFLPSYLDKYRLFENEFDDRGIVAENGFFNLKLLLDCVRDMKKCDCRSKECDSNGKRIYEYVKGIAK